MDVNTGEIAWQIPYGTMNGVPAGIKAGAPSSRGGPTTTGGGLIFITGTIDHYFRAFETKTGKELWSFKMDQVPLAVPVVYAGRGGKEYVAIADGENLIAFALAGPVHKTPVVLPVAAQLPGGDSKDLVQNVCTGCHSIGLITSRRQSRTAWNGTVRKMAQSGASATDEQFNAIVDYLTKNFGPGTAPKN